MRLSDKYILDRDGGFWRNSEQKVFDYTDGDETERRIGEIVRGCSDPSVLSDEIARAITDWPSLYHLGKGRVNLLRPFLHLFSGKTLEIGCGCGAITRALGEAGGQVLALEGSSTRAEICASRSRGLSNVTVVCESFDQFEHEDRFDVVTLIGVLEYARKYFHVAPGVDPVIATLEKAKGFLRPGGVLLVAIENQMGLKYLAGIPEDHNGVPMYGIEDLYAASDAVTFGEKELSQLIGKAGLPDQQWWYPFPDYKFPVSIFSEAGVRASNFDLTPLLQNSVVTDPQRAPTSFSLESAWAPVFRNGLAGALANSFVILASDTPVSSTEDRVLAYHYASGRRPGFAKQVAFIERPNGEVGVRHIPLFSESEGLSAKNLTIEFEETDFVSGQHWQKELIRVLNRPGWSVKDLEPWAETWYREFLRHTRLGENHALNRDTPVSGDHFDAVPRNLIVQERGGVFFDQEWRLREQCTLGFIVFRSLGLSFFGVTSVASAHQSSTLRLQDILLELSSRIGIELNQDDFAAYVQTENLIQTQVGADVSAGLTIELFSEWRLNVRAVGWDPSRQYQLEAQIVTKDEALRQLGSEVHRLQSVVLDKDALLSELGHKLSELYEVLAAKDEALEEHGRELLRLETFASEKQRLVQELGRELNGLHQGLSGKDQAIATQAAEIRRLESAIQGFGTLPSQLDETNGQVEHRLKECAQLQMRLNEDRSYFYAEVAKRDELLAAASSNLEQVKLSLGATAKELTALQQTRWFRLREVVLFQRMSLRKLVLLASIIGGAMIPAGLRPSIVPLLSRLLGIAARPSSEASGATGAYQVQRVSTPADGAPKVVHVIANFMTGGSSRLVVDIVEYLGHYEQVILTSFNPNPPAYVGVEIEECRFPESIAPFLDYFRRVKPDLVHVHYWGDCDEPWYEKAINAAKHLGLPVIENINTPIAPFHSDIVARYVYVSDYVRSVFGESDARHVTVYPGSDFKLFTRSKDEHAPDNCVGMVYRLERDKLNEDAIQPFIRIAQLRPKTRILIVGGGSLLESFMAAVRDAGVAENFEFTGYVSYSLLPALYGRMSLFVAPVWKESFGQVSPFAMSMKVPVVGYDIGAIGEIVGDNTLLAPAADADALAEIAVRLLDAPEQRREIGDAQQKRAEERFSIQAMISHYSQIYGEIIEDVRQERL